MGLWISMLYMQLAVIVFVLQNFSNKYWKLPLVGTSEYLVNITFNS